MTALRHAVAPHLCYNALTCSRLAAGSSNLWLMMFCSSAELLGVTILSRLGRAASGMKHPLIMTTRLGNQMALQPSSESDHLMMSAYRLCKYRPVAAKLVFRSVLLSLSSVSAICVITELFGCYSDGCL